MTKFALYVPLQAKPGKEKEVADFLRSAVPLVNAELGTISWFAIQEGPSSFAIFDTFDDEAGRDAHLNGKVAAALMEKAKAGDLFAKAPRFTSSEFLRTSFRNKMAPAAAAPGPCFSPKPSVNRRARGKQGDAASVRRIGRHCITRAKFGNGVAFTCRV